MNAQKAVQIVYVVDDDELVRESVEIWLIKEGYNVVAFSDSDHFMESFPSLMPGCVLLDMQMPGIDGLSVLERAQPYLSIHPVIVMTGFGDVAMAVRTMKLGATDFIEKPCRREVLVETLELAFQKLEGCAVLAPRQQEVARIVSALTPRERDVLEGLMDGLSNKALARRFDLSPRTVEMHRANMMRRLGVRSLSEALKLGLMANGHPAERSEE